MMSFLDRLMLLPIAYLAGSIPTGVILGHLKGVDVRAVGSGNIGATNVTRALGGRAGAITLVGDAAKGLIPVLLAHWLYPGAWVYASAVALLAVLGHCFSIFLDFNGGKGVATSAGVFLGLAPFPVMASGLVWVAVVLATRVSSFGAFAALPVLVLSLVLPDLHVVGFTIPTGRVWLPLAVAIAAVVLFRHKANLRRMVEGAEHRFRT